MEHKLSSLMEEKDGKVWDPRPEGDHSEEGRARHRNRETKNTE